MLHRCRIISLALLLCACGAVAAEAAEPGFRLAGHSGVASVEETSELRLSRGTDDLLFVWSKASGAPRAWRRIEPDAATLLQGDRVALFADTTLSWLSLPALQTVAQEEIGGFVRCRGGEVAWSWTKAGQVTLHDANRSVLLTDTAVPGDDASCLISPLGTLLLWSEEQSVKALLQADNTRLLSATIPNDGIVDAGASGTAVWAMVRSAGTDTVVQTRLLGEPPLMAPTPSGWRTCDTFDETGRPKPCVGLSEAAAAGVTRPRVPDWNGAIWSVNRLALTAPGRPTLPRDSEAGWATAPATAEASESVGTAPRQAVVRGRRLTLEPLWMAGCAEQAWRVDESAGDRTVTVAGPICGGVPHWVQTPDDRWAMLQIPGRATALVWSDRPQPSRLSLPEAASLSLTLALRTGDDWWVADAAMVRAWRQAGGDAPAWTEAPIPLLADRSLTLSRVGETLTLQPADSQEPATHFLVTDHGTAAWRNDGSWWADAALLPHLVWVTAEGTPLATDDPIVAKRNEKRLLVRLWDRLADDR
jgi:hypothetical protein